MLINIILLFINNKYLNAIDRIAISWLVFLQLCSPVYVKPLTIKFYIELLINITPPFTYQVAFYYGQKMINHSE
jgi:hypothetical protein